MEMRQSSEGRKSQTKEEKASLSRLGQNSGLLTHAGQKNDLPPTPCWDSAPLRRNWNKSDSFRCFSYGASRCHCDTLRAAYLVKQAVLTWSNRLSCSPGSDSCQELYFLTLKNSDYGFLICTQSYLVSWQFFHSFIHSRIYFRPALWRNHSFTRAPSYSAYSMFPFKTHHSPAFFLPSLTCHPFSHWHPIRPQGKSLTMTQERKEGFPGSPVVKNLPASAGDRGLITALGCFHMLRAF